MKHLCSYLFPLLAAGLFTPLVATQTAAAPVFFADEAAFQTAAGPLTTDDFEGYSDASDLDDAPVDWGALSCLEGVPVSFCTAYSGLGDAAQFGVTMRSGSNGMTFATPDTLELTFTDELTAFGIWIGGFGNQGPLDNLTENAGTLSATVAGTTTAILSGHSNLEPAFGGGNSVFFGVIDAAGFDVISFFGTNQADSVFFDDMSYASAAPVPLPASAALLVIGLGGLCAMRRPKKA